MYSETVPLSGPRALGDLQIELDPNIVDAGATAVVSARVTNLVDQEVRVVLQVRGLPLAWCPPAQVLTLPATNTAKVFQHITPPPGTPPGRYQWTLTAETAHRPMQGATSELTVRRPQLQPARARPQKKRWPWLVPVVAVVVLAVVLAAVLFLRQPKSSRSSSAAPTPTAISSAARPSASSSKPASTQSPTPMASPPPLPVSGTIQAENAQFARDVEVYSTRLDLVGLSSLGSGKRKPVRQLSPEVKGKRWTLDLEPGVHAMTFQMPGYQPQTIVVDTGLLEFVPVPPVKLLLDQSRT